MEKKIVGIVRLNLILTTVQNGSYKLSITTTVHAAKGHKRTYALK